MEGKEVQESRMGASDKNEQKSASLDSSREQIESQADYYSAHLAKSSDRNQVVTTQDIVSQNGVLLVKKGHAINDELSERLLKHKLLNPLEEQVQLEHMFTGKLLYENFLKLKDLYPDIGHIHEQLAFDDLFKKLCLNYDLPDIIMQKLTVMADNHPVLFNKCLFSAWLSTLIAREMGLNHQQTMDAFHAGLLRDIGFLNLPPELLDKKGDFTPEEWRSVQSHAVIGSMIIDRMNYFSPHVSKAILEHHERLDGAGYPVGKVGQKLSTLGQIVAMADAIQAQRMQQLENWELSLRYIEAFLYLNTQTYTYDIYRAVHNFIRKSELPEVPFCPCETVTLFRKDVVEWNLQLQLGLECLQMLRRYLMDMQNVDKERQSIETQITVIESVINSSGVLREEIVGWLQEVTLEGDDAPLQELTEIYLLQHEICWHLKHLSKNYNNYLERKESAGEELPLEMDIMAKSLRDHAYARN